MRTVIAAILIAATGALALAGCTSSNADSSGTVPAPGSYASAAPASSFAPSGSVKYGWAIRYPKSWPGVTKTAPAGDTSGASAMSTTWADPKGKQAGGQYLDALQVSVYKMTSAVTAADLRKHAADFKAIAYGLIKGLPKFEMSDAPRPITVNGSKGFQVTYTYTVNGVPAGAMSYLFPKGRYAYWVTGQASKETWAGAWSLLTPAMASFTIKSAK